MDYMKKLMEDGVIEAFQDKAKLFKQLSMKFDNTKWPEPLQVDHIVAMVKCGQLMLQELQEPKPEPTIEEKVAQGDIDVSNWFLETIMESYKENNTKIEELSNVLLNVDERRMSLRERQAKLDQAEVDKVAEMLQNFFDENNIKLPDVNLNAIPVLEDEKAEENGSVQTEQPKSASG